MSKVSKRYLVVQASGGGQTDTQTGTQTDTQTETQTDTQTDTHTDTHINTMIWPGLGAGPSENNSSEF